jgi:hypothetical protein
MTDPTDHNNTIELASSLASMVAQLMIEAAPRFAVLETTLRALSMLDPDDNGAVLRDLQAKLSTCRLLIGPAATDVAFRVSAYQLSPPDSD